MATDSPQETVNFGKSLLVPSVQELAKQALTKIPPRYMRDEENPPVFASDETIFPSVPVIDLESLISGDHMDSELARLHYACKEWGFFQVF